MLGEESIAWSEKFSSTPRPCPFCGASPIIEPANPDDDYDLWGVVHCANEKCAARPEVGHGEREIIVDGRSSRFYVDAAIRRWNVRTISN